MKTIKITKQTILKALLTEPLKAGSWVKLSRNRSKPCPVCAVGATLRTAGLRDDAIDTLGARVAFGMYGESKPLLGKLSDYFEAQATSLARFVGVQRNEIDCNVLRPKLIAWVEKNVPDTWSQVEYVEPVDMRRKKVKKK